MGTVSGLTSRWRKPKRSGVNGNCLEVAWVKSSHSALNGCLEAAVWHRSSRSVHGDCTEAALRGGTVLVRDSKMAHDPGHEGPDGPQLAFSRASWNTFLGTVKAGLQ